MKTTLEIPEDLMHAVKVRAAATGRKLKDVVAELIRRGLEGPPDEPAKSASRRWRKNSSSILTAQSQSIWNRRSRFFEALNRSARQAATKAT